jgi:hypothetical protein
MREVLVLEDAAVDLEAGKDFYDASEFGVGSHFADSVIADIESLAILHGIHSVHFGYHRMLASHFPFGIYYAEGPSQTRVVADLDLRRDPSWLREEIASRSR